MVEEDDIVETGYDVDGLGPNDGPGVIGVTSVLELEAAC
jgi:hypothetical protein